MTAPVNNAAILTGWQRADRQVFETTRWERVRLIIEELGPTFIKLAQALSNRADLLPQALIDEFEKLQSNVPPFDVAVARQLIEQELGRPISEVFSEFDDVTLGSASIGQVHRARLLTGEEVVVKVQRPGVREKVRSDLALLHELVRLTAGFLQKQGLANPQDIVDAFERSMSKELDYTAEARSMEQFRKLYEDYTTFYVPKPYRERIFEPFFRLPGHAEREGGVGLGLALVRQIVLRHGGQVQCQPREGGGSCFVLTLPAA